MKKYNKDLKARKEPEEIKVVKKISGRFQHLTPTPPGLADIEYKKLKPRQRFRKRTAIEAIISHLKKDFLLVRCSLKGEIGC